MLFYIVILLTSFEISRTTLHIHLLSSLHRGLILHRPLGPSAPKINTNDWLRIGSTFHSLHAIAAEASPVKLPGNKNPGEKSLNTSYVLVFAKHCREVFILTFIIVIMPTNIIAGADDGIEEIEGGGVILKCLQTRTGIKFVLT